MGFGKAARLAARLPHACASSSQRRATQRAQIAAPRARQPLSSPGPRPAAPCPPCGRPPLARPARPHRQEAASVRSCFSCCTVTCAFAYEQLRSPASASCQASELTIGVTHGTRNDDRRTERSSRAASRGACSDRGFSRGAVTQGVRLARLTGEQDGRAHAGRSDWPLQTKHNVWASDHLQGRGPGAPDAHQQLPVEDRRPVRPGQAAQRARATGLAGGRRGVRRRERPCGRGRRRSAAAAAGEQGVDDAVVGHHIALRLLVQLRAARARRSAQRSSAPHTAAVALSGPWGFRGPTDSMRRAPFAKASMA